MSSTKSRVDEDDDLDDLDDVLDQFSSPDQPTSGTTASTNAPVPDTHEAPSDDLAEELARGMESLLRGLGAHSDAAAASEGTEREQLAAAWEAMLIEGMNATSDSSASTPAGASSSQANFQSRIRSAMDRFRESESGLQTPDPSASGDGESLQSLLSQFQALGNLSDGDEDAERLQEVLEAMMSQLMSKDVLYGPLKELHEKFPNYLADNASTISDNDKRRYEAQMSCIKRLTDEFEASTYRDEDRVTREKIVGIMNELQTHGQPPAEIMGPLPPGFTLGEDGLPDVQDCNVN